jgi:hypothetical protein
MIVGPMIVRTNEASIGTTATASKADCCEPVGYKREHVPLA